MQESIAFYYIFNSSFTQFFGLDGIVLYPFVLISTTRKETPRNVLKHELVHVAQIRREGGPIRFYTKYVYSTVKRWIETGDLGKAYDENEYEVEAYGTEHKPLTKAEKEEIL